MRARQLLDRSSKYRRAAALANDRARGRGSPAPKRRRLLMHFQVTGHPIFIVASA
jgi:hypothetical protein